MAEKQTIDAMWDDSPVDVSTEVNFIWSIANKLRGTYQSDKYKDVIIPMVIIRRFECALAPTKQKVVDQFKANPAYPAKAMYQQLVQMCCFLMLMRKQEFMILQVQKCILLIH